MSKKNAVALWLFALFVGITYQAPIASAVNTAYKSAIIFGATAGTWSGATGGAATADHGVYWNSGDNLPHVRLSNGTEYAIPNAAVAPGGGYATTANAGTPLTQRTTVNFSGSGVSCVDNSGNARTDCTIDGPGTINVRSYGCKGDGAVDDTSCLTNAYAAVPASGTMYIPKGKYKITTTLSWNRAVSVVGDGAASVVWISLSDPTKQGVVVGAPYATSNVQAQSFRDFSVQGAPGSCVNGIAFYNVHRSRIDNVHVRPGSTQHAAVIGGSLISYYNLIISTNATGAYDAAAGQWNGAGILVADLRNGTPVAAYPGGSVMPTNACVFDSVVEGGTGGGGLAMEAQDQGGGNNVFTGTYEGFANASGSAVKGAGYAIKIEGGTGWTIRAVHAESSLNGTLVTNASKFSIADSVFFPIPSEKLTITSSTDFEVNDSAFGMLSIDNSNVRWNSRRCRGQMSGNTQSLTNETTIESFYDSSDNTYRNSGIGQNSGDNLLPSGNLARWPLSSSEMTYIGNNPTLTLTGEGLGDTTQRFYKRAVKVVGVDQSYVLSIPVPNPARYYGQPVTLWADVKNTGATDVYAGAFNGSAYKLRGISKAGTGWTRIGITIYPSAADFAMVFRAVTNAAYTFYLGGFGAVIGETMPSGIEAPFPSSADGMLLAGQKITTGSAAPVAGTWAVGDLVVNTAPASGTNWAWVCTVAGTPGTWAVTGSVNNTLTTPVIATGLTASGAGVVDFSGSTATFKFPTGNVTNTPTFASGFVSNSSVTINGNTTLNGTLKPSRTTVVDANTTATGLTFVAYTSISAARVVTGTTSGGASAQPVIVIIKDESGSASGVNTITFQGSTGNIDGAATKVCVNSAFGSCRVYSNGTNWFTW